jgi:hypothetical protein
LEVRASSMIRAEDIGKRAQMNTVLTTQNWTKINSMDTVNLHLHNYFI